MAMTCEIITFHQILSSIFSSFIQFWPISYSDIWKKNFTELSLKTSCFFSNLPEKFSTFSIVVTIMSLPLNVFTAFGIQEWSNRKKKKIIREQFYFFKAHVHFYLIWMLPNTIRIPTRLHHNHPIFEIDLYLIFHKFLVVQIWSE